MKRRYWGEGVNRRVVLGRRLTEGRYWGLGEAVNRRVVLGEAVNGRAVLGVGGGGLQKGGIGRDG